MDLPRSILVLKPSSFGDIIHTLPAVARLREHWPDSRISWLANTEWCPLLEGNPAVDRVVPFPRKQLRGLQGLLALPRWLRGSLAAEGYELVLDFQGLLRTALLGRFAKGKRFLGLADAREGATLFYDRIAPIPGGVPHAVERYLALARTALEEFSAPNLTFESGEETRFPLPAGEPVEKPEMLHDNFVLLHPFARGKDKSLLMDQVRALCAGIEHRQVVLVGNASVGDLGLPSRCLNLLNRTSLQQLIWLVRRAGFVISVDSGPAHLAAALARPMVAIHTWSDPRKVGPYRATAWILKSGELLRFRDLHAKTAAFFTKPAVPPTPEQIEAICHLATSF